MLLESQKLDAMPTALGRLFHAHCPLGEEPYLHTQPDPPLTQLIGRGFQVLPEANFELFLYL